MLNLMDFTLFDDIKTDYNVSDIKSSAIALDFEVYPDSYVPQILAVAYGNNESMVFDIDVLKAENKYDVFLNDFFNLLDSVDIVIAHNFKMELNVLKQMGYDIYKLFNKIRDTMSLVYVLDSNKKVGLKYNIEYYFNEKRESWEEVVTKNYSRDKYKEYCRQDAIDSYRLYNKLYPVCVEKGADVAFEIENQLIYVLMEMENYGVPFDVSFFNQLKKDFQIKLEEKIEEIYKFIGTSKYDLKKNRHVAEIIYDIFKVPLLEDYKTNKGERSVSEAVIQDILNSTNKYISKDAKKFCSLYLEYKKLFSFQTKYLSEKFLNYVGPDSRLRPKFISSGYSEFDESSEFGGPVTSRLSSREPNMQNLPHKGEWKIFRKCVKAEKGYKLIVADYSQAEVRVMAHFSQEPNFIEAYKNNLDVHVMTRDKLRSYGIALAMDDKEGRNIAKVVNFATPYGIKAKSLAKKLNCSVKEAKEILDSYYLSNPNVYNYLKDIINFVYDKRYLRLVSGQYIYFDKNEFIDNVACNYPIQGFVGCLTKLVMIWSFKRFFNTPVKLILQVHDELIWHVPEEMADEVKEEIEFAMANIHKISVPFPAEAKIGNDWYSAKDL